MCGIVGLFIKDKALEPRLGELTAGMLATMCERGPDSAGFAAINPLGQFIGALIMFFVLGFFPGLIVAGILNMFGVLRVPRDVELMGLDFSSEEARQASILEVQAAEKAAYANGR
jgi:ammonia channel protein AmtB